MSDFISIPEAARRAATPEKAIRDGCLSGYIKSVRQGHRLAIPIAEFESKILPGRYYTIPRAAGLLCYRKLICTKYIERWLTAELGEGTIIDRLDLDDLGERVHAAYMTPL